MGGSSKVIVLSQNKRLILAGFVAFAVLALSQISVQGMEFFGNLNTTPTIGGYPVLTIGTNSSIYSSLNIGLTPIVTTIATSGKLSETQEILTAYLSSLGGVNSVNVYFEYGSDTNYGLTSPSTTKSTTGNFAAIVNNYNKNHELHYRAVVKIGDSVTVYGNDETIPMNSARGIIWLIPIAGAGGLLVAIITKNASAGFIVSGLLILVTIITWLSNM